MDARRVTCGITIRGNAAGSVGEREGGEGAGWVWLTVQAMQVVQLGLVVLIVPV